MEKEPQKEPQPESKEGEPKISYHILYGPHKTPEDFKKLEELFEKADIYIPERLSHDAKIRDWVNKLSQGKMTPEEVLDRSKASKTSHLLRQYQIIYNSKKPILFADVPVGHELLEAEKESDKLGGDSLDLFKSGEFKSALKKIRDYVIEEADFELKREELIKKNLKEKIKEFISNRPELKEKDEVRVLLTLGAFHTKLYHDLKREGYSASREFTRQPMIYLHSSEAMRRLVFSKDKKPNKTMLARGILDALLTSYYVWTTTKDTSKAIAASYKLSSKLNLKDIKKISEGYKKYGGGGVLTIADVLKDSGIKIPKTEEEMDKMLGIEKEK